MLSGACVPNVPYRVQGNSALGVPVAVEFDLCSSVDGHDRLPWLCLALALVWQYIVAHLLLVDCALDCRGLSHSV